MKVCHAALWKGMLGLAGYEILVANNGRDAMERLLSENGPRKHTAGKNDRR
jgi:hypothetical protein